jgi:uncharacterized cupin superfamily protein
MMAFDKKLVFSTAKDVEMKPCPINPAWVIEGAPVARNFILSVSLDGTATALVWDCTTGVFHWRYNVDETVYVLEGSAVIRDDSGVERVIQAGDHMLFRAGSHAVWRVETYIRKVAFCRTPVPAPLMFMARVLRKLRRLIGASHKEGDAPSMFSDA